MSKIAIVGATGHYGGKAIEALLKHGINPKDIVAIYRNKEKTVHLKELGLEMSYGDYQSGNYTPEVFKGAEKLLFISGAETSILLLRDAASTLCLVMIWQKLPLLS